jgi:hypothetical protein
LSARLDLDLKPGRRCCASPDTTAGTDHLHNGMATVFTVPSSVRAVLRLEASAVSG